MKRLLPLLALLFSTIVLAQSQVDISIPNTSGDNLYHGRYPAGNAPAPDGATIPAYAFITDGSGNKWTVGTNGCAAGIVCKNGSAAGVSSGVTLLLYFGGTIYQYNGTQYFPWTGSAWGVGQGDPRGGGGSGGSGGGSSTFGIKVMGNTFTDLNGTVVQLQGTNVTGSEISYANGMWDGYYNTTQAQWSAILSSWQMNVIRLPFNEWAWRTNAKSSGGIPYQTLISTTTARITAAGAYVILDLHWAAPASYNGSLSGNNIAGYADGQPGYLNGDYSASVWASVATTFQSNPAVMFEILNEPYGDGNSNGIQYLKNGSGSTQINFYDQEGGKGGGANTGHTMIAAGHQQIVNAIRATGATNVILWSTPAFNSDMADSLNVRPTDTLNPSQLGATIHYGGGSQGNYQTVLNAGFPIVETEYYSPVLNGNSGYTFLQSAHVGYVMWGVQNWSGNATSNLCTGSPGPQLCNTTAGRGSNSGAPWNFNAQSVPWALVPPPTAPAPAAAAGYKTKTFDSTTLGTTTGTLQSFNFFGNTEPGGQAVQSGANIVFNGTSHYGLSSAVSTGGTGWRGTAFGGGAYFEATVNFSGTPAGGGADFAWWANDVEHMSSGNSAYTSWVEPDFIETNVTNTTHYGIAAHNWYCTGSPCSGNTAVNLTLGSPVTVSSINGTHTYGFLWVPATSSSQGCASYYFDNVQVGSKACWNQYSSGEAFPPAGANVFNVIDARHLVFIIGSSAPWANPLTLSKLRVWQLNSAGNVIQ